MTETASLMTALFADHASAECAYASLAARGYTPADLRLHMSSETRDRLLASAVSRREHDGAIAALVTALVTRRLPPERVALYDEGVREGGIVMGLMPNTLGAAAGVADGGRHPDHLRPARRSQRRVRAAAA